MYAVARPVGAFLRAVIARLGSRAIIFSSFSRVALNDHLVEAVQDVAGVARRAGRSIGLIGTMMVSSDTHSRHQRVMVGFPEYPPSQ